MAMALIIDTNTGNLEGAWKNSETFYANIGSQKIAYFIQTEDEKIYVYVAGNVVSDEYYARTFLERTTCRAIDVEPIDDEALRKQLISNPEFQTNLAAVLKNAHVHDYLFWSSNDIDITASMSGEHILKDIYESLQEPDTPKKATSAQKPRKPKSMDKKKHDSNDHKKRSYSQDDLRYNMLKKIIKEDFEYLFLASVPKLIESVCSRPEAKKMYEKQGLKVGKSVKDDLHKLKDDALIELYGK
jgi:hypothetical protein